MCTHGRSDIYVCVCVCVCVFNLPEGPQLFLSTRVRVRAWRAPEVQSSIGYRFFGYTRFLKCLQTLNRDHTRK